MKPFRFFSWQWTSLLGILFAPLLFAGMLSAQIVPTNAQPQYGPYNNIFLQGGDGLREPVAANDTVLRADSPWTLSCWVRFDEPIKAPTLLAGLGETTEEYSRYLSVDARNLSLWMGKNNSERSGSSHT